MSIFAVPIIKGGPGATVNVETDNLQEDDYKAVVSAGLKVVVNGGTTKITKAAYKSDAEFFAAAIAKAEERVLELLEGKLKIGRGAAKSSGAEPAAVMTEARRLARQVVKDTMKKLGLKVSHYSASEITKEANDLLADPENGAGFIAMAKENLAARKKPSITLPTLHIKADPALVAKDEAAKLERKAGTLSKTQAGKVAPRASLAKH